MCGLSIGVGGRESEGGSKMLCLVVRFLRGPVIEVARKWGEVEVDSVGSVGGRSCVCCVGYRVRRV